VPAGGYAPQRLAIWPPLIETLRQWVRAEAGAGRLLPWVPVAFGTGIAFYFAADHEPVLAVAAVVAVTLCVTAFLLRRHKVFPVAVMIAAFAAGFAVATWKTARIAHGVLARPMFSVSLTGFVETRDIRERTDRFVLRVATMESARGSIKLERVRLSVKKGTAPAVGSFVELKARLMPPLAPLRPGSYDFGRDMFFSGIGASGFVMGAVKTAEPPDSGGMRLRYSAFMQGLRDAIDARIATTLEGDKRAIATALLTGRRDAISTPVNDAMFISGLGHVLSISGYHMAVVAGVVFFAVRALLALFPALTVGYPIKKWSAAAALVAAAFYLLLSGAEVATQRSFFMTAVVLIAVMVDRRAITFRTLAVAALIVLAIAPEALVHPSFQMSFAATLGLVALVQIGMPALFAAPDNSTTARVALWGGRECVMIYPVPNASHKRYYAPGADEPMAYPLDKMDPHYGVPRTQFESMKSEPLGSAPCVFLTEGRRWSNVLGHPIGESFRWDSGEVLWDRSSLLWLFDYRLSEHQFNELWTSHWPLLAPLFQARVLATPETISFTW